MLRDDFFPWPYGGGLDQAIKELGARLDKTALAPWLASPGGNLAEYMAAVCRDWDVNPWWLMVSAQREQSALNGQPLTAAATAAWLGYVGKDAGRVAFPGYYGIYTQIYRCASQTSWYMGRRPDARAKKPPRWRPGVILDGEYAVEQDGVKKAYRPLDMAQCVQLLYTCHLKVLPRNHEIALKECPQFL